jgi:hypothetical protein
MRLVILAATLAYLVVGAAAAGARSPVLTDCARNEGIVAGQYSVSKLRAAYREIPETKRVSADCGQSVASHLAYLRGLRGGRQAGDVLDDCTRHGGRLTQRFAPHALTRAARLMTTARREQTRCLIGIVSQLRARGRPVAITAPTRSRVGGPYDSQTGEQLRDSLAKFTAALRRDLEPYDAIPQNVIDMLVRRNRERNDGFDFFSVRRVGPDQTAVWLVVANGRMCGIRWYGDTIRPDLQCVNANRWAKGEAMLALRPHSDATQDLWGVIPDDFTEPRLLFGEGDSSRPLLTAGNGTLDELEELPGAVEWSAGGGKQWFDTTRMPCLAYCLSVPAVAGIS